jgi:hypothetical protein
VPVLPVVNPPVVAEGPAGAQPPLGLAGTNITPASVVLLWAWVGKRLVVVELRTLFVNGVLVVRLPSTLPGLHGKPWVLDEDAVLILGVLTPGVGMSALLRVPVLEAAHRGRVGTAGERAQVDQLEMRLGRELTLDDLPPRVME